MKSCGNCGKESPKHSCSRCRSVFYCDRECQKQHWKKGHKNFCATVSSVLQEVDSVARHWRKINTSKRMKNTRTSGNGNIFYCRKDKSVKMIKKPTGETFYYDGPVGKEALKRILYEDNEEEFFEGERGKECLKKILFPDKSEQHYSGERK